MIEIFMSFALYQIHLAALNIKLSQMVGKIRIKFC
jgi:hypothetical protein